MLYRVKDTKFAFIIFLFSQLIVARCLDAVKSCRVIFPTAGIGRTCHHHQSPPQVARPTHSLSTFRDRNHQSIQRYIKFLFQQLRRSRVKKPNLHTVSLSRSSVRRHDHPRHPLLPRQHSGCPRNVHHHRIPLHCRECEICHPWSGFCIVHGQRGSFGVESKRTSSVITMRRRASHDTSD